MESYQPAFVEFNRKSYLIDDFRQIIDKLADKIESNEFKWRD